MSSHTHLSSPSTTTAQAPVALQIPLKGRHLIEASAGTGKTWTLTTVLLRLLLENGLPARQLIATTFTRAAAAELYDRLSLGLQAFRSNLYELHEALEADLKTTPSAEAAAAEPLVQTVQTQLGFNLDLDLNSDSSADPNSEQPSQPHMLSVASTQAGFPNSQAEAKGQAKQLGKVSRETLSRFEEPQRSVITGFLNRNELGVLRLRVERASRELNQMSIGTLDSMCQKLIREFALEAGFSTELKLSGSAALDLAKQITANQLRMNAATCAADAPNVVELQAHCGRQLEFGHMVKNLNSLETYLSVAVGSFEQVNLYQLNQAVGSFREQLLANIRLLEPFATWVLQHSNQFIKGKYDSLKPSSSAKGSARMAAERVANGIDQIVKLATDLSAPPPKEDLYSSANRTSAKLVYELDRFSLHAAEFFEHFLITKDPAQSAYALFGARSKDKSKLLYQTMTQLDAYEPLVAMAQHAFELHEAVNKLDNQATNQLLVALQAKLPAVMSQKQITSYAHEVRRLAAALAAEQGPKLASLIRAQYPAVLIDECQDINSDQASLLSLLYPSSLSEQALSQLFVLLVGDPKQAIYSFRGADVRNYLQIKSGFQNYWQLDTNFRSSGRLIEALNQFFAVNPKISNGIEYTPVKAAKAHAGSYLGEPVLSWLSPANKENKVFEAVAQQCVNLLHTHNREASELCVLVRSNKQMHEAAQALQDKGVPVNAVQGSTNLFQTEAAGLLVQLLKCFIEPKNLKLTRALAVSRLMLWSQSELEQAEQDSRLTQLQWVLSQASERWHSLGLVAAWGVFSSEVKLHERLLAYEQTAPLSAELTQLCHVLAAQVTKVAPEDQLHALERWCAEPPDEEWASKLESAAGSGVQVMTMHKSKGLEFPVVFVVGLVPTKNNEASTWIHHVFHVEQSQSFVQNWYKHPSDEVVKQNHQLTAEENKRLAYVALTRASELVYLCNQNPLEYELKNHKSYLASWVTAELPQTQVECDSRVYETQAAAQRHKPEQLPVPLHFYALGQTSFSRLAKTLSHAQLQAPHASESAQQSAASLEPQPAMGRLIEDELSEPLSQALAASSQDTQPEYLERSDQPELELEAAQNQNTEEADWLDCVAFGFKKGAEAGSFLHRVLEVCVPHQQVSVEKLRMIEQAFALYTDTQTKAQAKAKFSPMQQKLLELDAAQRYELTAKWLNQVMQARLPEGASLTQVALRLLPELGFTMSASDPQLRAFCTLINKQIQSLTGASLSQLPESAFAYLTGEIDAVYEHQGKFWIVDYKSNHLGDQLADYSQAAMIQAMNEHGYWLQAGVYAVALHRFLKQRMPNQYQNAFGGVVYAFVRGMRAESSSGVLSLEFEPHALLSMDACL